MNNRRVNKQQLRRIANKQQAYQQRNTLQDDTLNDGLVLTRYSKHAYVEDTKGNILPCSIRPNIDSIVTGDRVIWQEEDHHHGVIISRYNRKSILGRPDEQGKIKPIAANITQILIVIAPYPEISWSLLDSYLVMAESLKINSYIVLNKTDLDCDAIQSELLKTYEPLGYPILFTNRNIQEDKNILKALHNQVSILVGQSGVGKSSLVAKILPQESARIRTQELSKENSLGRHTTSNSRFYHLTPSGGLIDSPGIRELSLWNMHYSEIAAGYREFQTYLGQCKFRDCTHFETPGCAIINAVKNKIITSKRYENYLKMLK